MRAVDNYLVKIIHAEKLATGFVYFPANDLHVYIFTACHSLQEETGDIDKSKISIQFSTTKTGIQLPEDVTIITNDNKEVDLAVIVLRRDLCPAGVTSSHNPILISLTGYEQECLITGFPKASDNEFIRSLYLVKLLSDRDFESQVQLETSDPMVQQYNGALLVEGYSGSPLMLANQAMPMIFGIFTGYEANTRRTLGIQISAINENLSQAGFTAVELVNVETRHKIVKDISSLKKNSDRVLARIKGTIGKTPVPRDKKKKELADLIIKNNLVFVSGLPGVGKSNLVKQAIEECSTDYEVIALQGEQLDKASLREIFSDPSIGLSNDLEEILNSCGIKSKKLILLDSIEKVLETKNAVTVADFFEFLTVRQDVKIVLTCRAYATEQFKIRFLKHYPSLVPFEVLPFDETELQIVQFAFPYLEPLLKRPSLKKILEIPFNLDKATFISEGVIKSQVSSEKDFKRIAWEYIVESKERESLEVQKHRATAFQKIILQRALAMSPTIAVPADISAETLNKLIQDNLIETSVSFPGHVAASHDIYEDWGLTRFINEAFGVAQNQDIASFFTQIGKTPAIRRAFRLWISEKIESPDYTIQRFIDQSLNGDTGQFWKDEIMVAILQSDYCSNFLISNKQTLYRNDFALFKRLMLLLRVACQVPDMALLRFFEPEKRLQLYSSAYLIPRGAGWSNLIEFVHAEYGNLKDLSEDIFELILQWGTLVNSYLPYPKESARAAAVLMWYLRPFLEAQERSYEKDSTKKGIQLLLNLSPFLKTEITQILELIIAQSRAQRKRLSSIHEAIIENVLTWSYSHRTSVIFPELTLQLAEAEWFYFPPSKEELDALRKEDRFAPMYFEDDLDNSRGFGVTSEYKRDYSPCSAYQTPIPYLLNTHPTLTIPFIVKLFNHSIDAFRKSSFLLKDNAFIRPEPRYDIQYTLSSGTVVRQYGSASIFMMYRALKVVTSALLQSVLMALELYLLQLAERIDKAGPEKSKVLIHRLDYAFDYLLAESRNVATSAVLISVATAYPKIIGRRILPLLTVPQFFEWDLHRASIEHSVLAPIGHRSNGQLIQNERIESARMPHRKTHLELLMIQLGLSELSNDIIKILDALYKLPIDEQNWKFSLNRMDFRKLEIHEYTDTGTIIRTKVDDDLKPIMERSEQNQRQLEPIQLASLWAWKKFKQEKVENDSFEQWQKHYENISGDLPNSNELRLFHQPAVLAAMGIRDFGQQLTEQQLTWCLDRIFSLVTYKLKKSWNPYDYDLDSPFHPQEDEPAFTSLIDLVNKFSGEPREHAKELLFGSLLLLSDRLDREAMIAKIKTELWEKSPIFAMSCVHGFIQHSLIAIQRIKITWAVQSSPPTKKKELDQMIESYENALRHIVESVKNETIKANLDSIDLTKSHPHYILQSVFIISPTIENPVAREYIWTVYKTIFNRLATDDDHNRIDSVDFESSQKLSLDFAAHLLSQSLSYSIARFNDLLSLAFEKGAGFIRGRQFDLIENCLEEILHLGIKTPAHLESFWKLWQQLAIKCAEVGPNRFTDLLLLDYKYWGSDNDWVGLKGRASFIESVVINSGSLEAFLKLLSGVGYSELLPVGLEWLSLRLNSVKTITADEFRYLEKLVIRIFYDDPLRLTIKSNTALRNTFINMLDILVGNSSSSAYLIREDFISSRK